LAATISRRLATIRYAHKLAGHKPPTNCERRSSRVADQQCDKRADGQHLQEKRSLESRGLMSGAQRKAPNRAQRSDDKADPRNSHGHGMKYGYWDYPGDQSSG